MKHPHALSLLNAVRRVCVTKGLMTAGRTRFGTRGDSQANRENLCCVGRNPFGFLPHAAPESGAEILGGPTLGMPVRLGANLAKTKL
jgi:hypothetical protein